MFKNILYSLLTKGTVALINFLILIVSSRYLGVSTRGEISIFLLNIAIIQVINEIYTGYSIVHFIPKFNLKRLVLTGIFITAVFAFLSNSIFVSLNKQVPGFEGAGFLVSLLVLLNTFFCVVILGKQNIRLYSLLSFLQPILLFTGILIGVFVFKDYTFRSYLYPLMCSFLVSFVISGMVVLGYLFHESRRELFELRALLINGLIYQSGLLMFIFVNRYSYYLLGDRASVGLYSAACSLMEAVLIISNGIAPVLLARTANEKSSPVNTETVLSLSKACFLITVLLVSIIILLPEDFFLLILGKGFRGITHLMLLYAPGMIMISVCGVITAYFAAIGAQRLSIWCFAAGCISTLLLAPVLVRSHHTSGAAITASISYAIISLCMFFTFVLNRKIHWKKIFSIRNDYKNLKAVVKTTWPS